MIPLSDPEAEWEGLVGVVCEGDEGDGRVSEDRRRRGRETKRGRRLTGRV